MYDRAGIGPPLSLELLAELLAFELLYFSRATIGGVPSGATIRGLPSYYMILFNRATIRGPPSSVVVRPTHILGRLQDTIRKLSDYSKGSFIFGK